MRAPDQHVFHVRVTLKPVDPDDEMPPSAIEIVARYSPDAGGIQAYAKQRGLTASVEFVELRIVETAAGAEITERIDEIAYAAESIVPGANVEPNVERLNDLERGQRGLQRQVDGIADGIAAILAQLGAPAATKRPLDVGAPAIERLVPRDHQVDDDPAQVARPTHRRDRPGATPEMTNGAMTLVGPAPTSSILEVGITPDGSMGIVAGKRTTVGDTLTRGTLGTGGT